MATQEELADILGALEEDDEWNQTPARSSAVQSTSGAHNMSASSDDDGFCPRVTVFESGNIQLKQFSKTCIIITFVFLCRCGQNRSLSSALVGS
jgi:hypothetical protein